MGVKYEKKNKKKTELYLNMKKKKITLWIVIIIFISNFPYVNKEILRVLDSEHFRYSNANASFTYLQRFDFKTGFINRGDNESIVKTYLNQNEDNIEIFRLYQVNLLCFWRWSYYLISSRQFRYKNWKEIELNRVPHELDNPYQRF